MCTVCGTAASTRHHRAMLTHQQLHSCCPLSPHLPHLQFALGSCLDLCCLPGTTGLEAARLAVHPWPSTQHKWAGVLQAEHSLELHLPYISYVMR